MTVAMKRNGELETLRGEVKTAPASAFRSHPSPVMRRPASRIPHLVWLLVITIIFSFVSLIVLAPLALAHNRNSWAFLLYQMFARVCHQIPERAFYLEGHPFAVCARCTGIYFGFAAGLLIYPLVRSLARADTPKRRWLLLAAAPALSDFALGLSGVVENTHFTRSLTGALLGAVAAFYVMPGLMDLSRMSFNRKNSYRTNPDGASQI
jgi:uncharacterized membrane protein